MQIRYEQVYVRNNSSFPACETFLDAIDEFILKPYQSEDYLRSMMQYGHSKSFMGDARFQAEPISELSTSSLELVYITLQILQKKEYLFNTP